MHNNYNDNWEEKMRGGIPKSIDFIKAKLSVELESYKASKSSVSDSLDQINNPFAQDGAGMEKNNVRVRKMDAPVSYPSYTPIDRSSQNDRQYYGGYSEEPSYQSYTNTSGSASALILTAVVALVVLVVFVSLFVMNSIGF